MCNYYYFQLFTFIFFQVDKEDSNQDVQDEVTDVAEESADKPSSNDDIPADFVHKRKTGKLCFVIL